MKSDTYSKFRISSLPVANDWQIVIDETGNLFGPEALNAEESSTDLGKVVALVTSERSKIQPVVKSFHAVRSKPEDVLDLLSRLFDSSEIGILGFTVKQPELIGISWVNAVTLLVRWICKLLPLPTERPVKLSFFIEQRQKFVAGTDLRVLSDTLLSSLQGAFPGRYEHTKLRIEFITKDGHPHNGYADALAYLWGSSKPQIKEFLEQSKLLGANFIQAQDDVLERLYLALHEHYKLLPNDWYSVISAALKTQNKTLIHDALNELGDIVRHQPERWALYSEHLNYLQQIKQFNPHELYSAYSWLRKFYPEQNPPEERHYLSFISGEIAAENHLGHVDTEHAEEAIQLANELAYEDMPSATQLVLRASVTYTNALKFQAALEYLLAWSQFPIIALGRLNAAKLKSAIGQCYAFLGDYESANRSFADSQLIMLQISDQRTRKRDLLQTQHYQLLVSMDEGSSTEKQIAYFLQQAGLSSDLALAAKEIAKSGSEHRFTHYLWLRMCFKSPEFGRKYFPIYYANQSFWQRNEAHPWGLINFYRAYLVWLLNGDTKELEQLLKNSTSTDYGFTLRWIQRVQNAVSERILQRSSSIDSNSQYKELDSRYLHAFISAPRPESNQLLHEECAALLVSATPFNFH